MNDTVRILVLEARTTDYELALREIRRSLTDCTFEQAKTRNDFIKALKSFQPDIILADYNLPHFNGIKSLELAQEHAPFTPIIIWTDDGNEKIAVECVKAGANNYIIKENIGRLGAGVIHALAERKLLLERKQTKDALSLLSAALDSATDGILVVAPNGDITNYNRQFLDLWHIPADLAAQKDDDELLKFVLEQLKDPSAFIAKVEALYQSPDAISFDELEFRDGRVFERYSQPQRVGDSVLGRVWSFRDITERRQAEVALRQSRERFAGIVNSAMDGIISIDTDQRIVLFNPSAEKMFGCTASEAIGQSIDRFIPERFRTAHREHISRFGKTGAARHIMGDLSVIDGLRADGTQFPIEGTISREENGDQNLYTIVLRDITERKKAEAALQDSTVQFRTLFEASPEAIMLIEPKGDWVILDCNPAACQMNGYTRDEMLGRSINILNFAPEAPDERQAYLERIRQANVLRYETLHRHKNGTVFPVEVSTSLIKLGERDLVLGIDRDITERKEAENALHARDALLKESQRLAGLGHYHLEVSTGQWESSDTLNEVLGIDWNYQTDLAGWANLIHPSQREEVLAYFKNHVLRDHNLFDREYLIVRFNDGQERWVYGLGRLEYDKNGNPIQMIGTIQDITERKKVEGETIRHLAELEALYENGLAVSRLLNPGEIGQQVIETFAHHLSWNHVAIRLRRNEDDLVLIGLNKPGISEAEKTEMERHFSSMVGKVGHGLSGRVVQTGKPLRTGDVHSYSQYVDTQAGIQSGLYMPLKIGERVIGVISVESEKIDAFSAQDERLLATLANQAAVAFENAHLYQAAQQEIADRKRAESALQTSETHYRDLADSITDVMFEMDQNLQFTHWNKSSELLTGIPKSEAIGKSMSEIFGDAREQMNVESICLNVLLNRAPKTFEAFLNWQNKQLVYEISAYPSTNGVTVVAKDITERRLSAIIMQKRVELMDFSVHNSLDDVMQRMLDEITELLNSEIGFFHFMEEDQSTPKGQIWSTKTLQLFNVPASEGRHQSLDRAGVWADAVRSRRPLIQNDYESLPSEKKGVPQGHAGIIREMVIPIIRNERIMAVMGIGNKFGDYTQQDLDTAVRFADQAWDIIERKQMELSLASERNLLARRVEERTSDLSRANSNLARALRVKDEFLANMSHELRTPLNAILGLSESLGEQTAGPLNEKQQRYIATISESGHHLLSLINDILDLAKIDAGQITLNINKVDIKSICEASLRMVKQLALNKEQDVALNMDDGIGLMWADERRLKQMLVNLLSNAVKFTPAHGKLGLEVRGDQTANQVSFAVWDNGIGIKDNEMPLLFQPFVQLNGGLDRENAGTGLGLALVAQMARLHGGSVTVESQTDQGSRFIITLPWEPALSPDAVERLRITGRLPTVVTDDHQKHTLLVIEDTLEVTMMLQDYLENAGYRVFTAQDGLEGIDQAKLRHPDLILMDIQMPRIDGFEATKRLRGDPEFEHTPIVALTALAMPNDRELCLAAGMDEYISKPVNLKMLLKIIKSFLSNGEGTAKSQ